MPSRTGPISRPGPINSEIAGRLGHLTLDDAIDIALHRNPQILTQLQEIQRNYGLLITARAAALPQLIASGNFTQTDTSLLEAVNGSGSTSAGLNKLPAGAVIPLLDSTGTAQVGAIPVSQLFGGSENQSSRNYTVMLEVQQTVYNAAIPPSIRAARFLRDAAYYALRETVDTTINTVKTDFYTVLFDQANIDNQNENLRLLQSQLTDQQNRFAAGTVPRFDVLQASVAVGDQRPNVITAENNFRLGYIGLARTLGIEYGPAQERETPLKLIGNLDYHPQNFSPDAGVAAGKQNRAILKQLRLGILADIESIRVQAAGYLPVVIANAGVEARNNDLSDDLGNSLQGWFFGGQFNWNIFDGLATYGRVKQAKAVLREARIAYEDNVNAVVEDIQSNYLTLQQSKQLIASQVLNVSEAEEAVAALAGAAFRGCGHAARRADLAAATPRGADDRTPGALQLRRRTGQLRAGDRHQHGVRRGVQRSVDDAQPAQRRGHDGGRHPGQDVAPGHDQDARRERARVGSSGKKQDRRFHEHGQAAQAGQRSRVPARRPVENRGGYILRSAPCRRGICKNPMDDASSNVALVPVETFPGLRGLGCRHGFIARVAGVDVNADRAVALARLEEFHRQARRDLGLGGRMFVTAEQVHGREVAVLAADDPLPEGAIAGVDGVVTNRRDVCLGIYVADCCAVCFVDPARHVIGLVHSGKKGTELGIVTAALSAMTARFGTRPDDVVAQLSPCIRPPWYETEFAAQIVAQCREVGVARVEDEGANTAADLTRFYSYRREKGRTGRMLALLALV